MPTDRHPTGAPTCAQGHPLDQANTYVSPTGATDCRTCKRERRRRSTKRGVPASIERRALFVLRDRHADEYAEIVATLAAQPTSSTDPGPLDLMGGAS